MNVKRKLTRVIKQTKYALIILVAINASQRMLIKLHRVQVVIDLRAKIRLSALVITVKNVVK